MRNAGTLQARLRAGHEKTAFFYAPLEVIGIHQTLPATSGLVQPTASRGGSNCVDSEDNFFALVKAQALKRFEYSLCKARANRSAHGTPRNSYYPVHLTVFVGAAAIAHGAAPEQLRVVRKWLLSRPRVVPVAQNQVPFPGSLQLMLLFTEAALVWQR
jgi:hypothetical protein